MKLLVVDDHPIFVAACRALFEVDGEIAVTGAHSAEATRSAIRTSRPDVVIIDANLSGGSGLELVRELIAEDPSLRIIVLSVVDEPRIVHQALDHGAKGFVSKHGETEELIRAVLAVAW
jgi:DNA-binding NarL/FixJ family response regulator